MLYSAEQAKELREKDFFDSRNVADRFKDTPTEEIKKILDDECSDLIIIASNNIRDFNWGSVVRSANSFNCNSVTFHGRRGYDRRGAVGAQNYTHITYYEDDIKDLFWDLRMLCGYTIVAAEYDERYEMTSLQKYEWNQHTALILGEEGRGLEKEILDLVDDIVYIPMFGSVRSLNLASAATTFMYDYNVKMGRM